MAACRRNLLFGTCSALAAIAALSAQHPAFDLIIRHGTVFDGSGLAGARADVGIVGGAIARVGDLSRESAAADIDATGLDVAPGFINIHSHAAPDALATAENMLTQGVTTEILNPDGGGALDLDAQLARASAGGLAVNIGAYIGFNSAWSQVVGPADRRATDADIAAMQKIVVDGLERGAWGVSAGLDYKPAYFAEVEEVARVLKPAAAWRTNFPNHDRLAPESNFSSRVGIGETLDIGARAGLVPVVTHMKVQGHEQGTAAELLATMQRMTARGEYVAADAYPYLAGQTGLGALLVPAWAQDGGRDAMLKRFANPADRTRIVAEIERAMQLRFGGPAGVYLPATAQQLTDVMREKHAPAGETVVQILEQGNTSAILRFGSEPDLVKILQFPATAIACDCGASTETRTHPRAYGTFPRVLGHYVRETHALTWADAIRKMTALPASTIGMIDRGYLAPGMAADVTVFDPATIIDHATYDDPAQRSDGVRFVVVNGHVALRDGRATGERGGAVLRRTRHMPSRPMTPASMPRRVHASGTIDGMRVAIDVSQRAGARTARGVVRLERGGMTMIATALGALQTTTNWAALTAQLSSPDGTAAPATVVVDRGDPQRPGATQLVVVAGGTTVADGVLK